MNTDLMRPARFGERLNNGHVGRGVVEFELELSLRFLSFVFELNWHFAFRLAANSRLNIRLAVD